MNKTLINLINKLFKLNSVFLVEKLWRDPLENKVSNAIGYEPYCVFLTEDEAIDFCKKGKKFTKNYCWAIRGEIDQYKYKEIKVFNNE